MHPASSPAPMHSFARSSPSSWGGGCSANRSAGAPCWPPPPSASASPSSCCTLENQNQNQAGTKQVTSPGNYQQREYPPLTGISANARPTTRPAAANMNQARSAAVTPPPHESPEGSANPRGGRAAKRPLTMVPEKSPPPRERAGTARSRRVSWHHRWTASTSQLACRRGVLPPACSRAERRVGARSP
jgi:hypothetical protein